MGRLIVKKFRGMNRKAKISFILVFTMLFTIFMYQGWHRPREAPAASVTYYVRNSSGTSVATGVTTNWSCSDYTGSGRIVLLNTATSTCSSARVTLSTNATAFEAYFDTAYSENKSVTGTSFKIRLEDNSSGGFTVGFRLLYVDSSGIKTQFDGSEVTQSVASGSDQDYTVDLSAQSATVPSGCKLGIRVRKISGSTSSARFYVGNSASRTSSSSGVLIVDEAAADTTPPTEGTLSVSPDSGNGYVPASFTITETFTDNESNITSCEYTLDGTSWNGGVVSGSKPNFTCTADVMGQANGTPLTIKMRATSFGGTSTPSNTLSRTVDSIGPSDGTLTVTPGNEQNALSWTAASDSGSGLAASNTYKVVYQIGATSPADCNSGTSLGYQSSPYIHTSLINWTTYAYRVCAYDKLSNVSSGATGSGTPSTINTTAGTCSASIPSSSTIFITMPYADDSNGNNTYNVDYKLSSSGTWTNWVTGAAHTASPYTTTITGLTEGQRYDVRCTYNDPNGVSGTNPQIISGLYVTTPLNHNSQITGSSYWTANSGWGIANSKYGAFTCGTCHQPRATNIKGVKNSVSAPNGTDQFPGQQGGLTVNLQSVTTPNGFGDDIGGHISSQKICEYCHSQTKYHRYDTSGQTNLNHKNNTDCAACHLHSIGFSAESRGGIECSGCHSEIYNQMNGSNTTYHHYMQSGAATYPTSATPGDSDKRCLMCHTDHNIFRPDINLANTGANSGRAANLRTDVTGSIPSTGDTPGSTYTNKDFDNALTNGGICISCHKNAQTKNTVNQKNDGTTQTPIIIKGNYSGSAHNYATSATFSKDNSTFYADCSKCHNAKNAETVTFQSSVNKIGTHDNTLRRLFASLGITSPTDPEEEDVCYRCHSKTTDTNPGGGPAKGTAQKDYYNATAMTTASEGLFTVFQKINPISTNTLYFKPTGQENPSEPMPNAHQTGDTFQGGTWIGRSMSPGQATAAYETKSQTTNSSTNPGYWRMITFTSPAVSSAIDMPAGNWTINIYCRESNAIQNAYVRYMIYKWNSADTLGTTIVAKGTYNVELTTTAAPGSLYSITVAGNAVSLAAGDKISVDIELETQNPGNNNYQASYYFGQGADSNLVMPASLTFPASGYGHNVAGYSGLHKPSSTDDDTKFTTNRHVECGDCHNLHATKQGAHTPANQWYPSSPSSTTNNVSNAIKNVTGEEPTWPAIWTAPTTFTSLSSSTKEYQICFKCHSYKGLQDADGVSPYTSMSGQLLTDQAMEFNPNNKSAHPVVVTANNQTGSYIRSGGSRKGITSAQILSPWQANIGNQTMYCSDCHGSDNENSGDPKGPHGSSSKYMLKGPGKYWPYKPDGTLWALNNSDAGNTNLFCKNCHPVYSGGWKNNTHSDDHHSNEAYTIDGTNYNGAPCVTCHLVIPHGGKRSRFQAYGYGAGASADVPPYIINTNIALLRGFKKASGPNNYGDEECYSTHSECDHHGDESSAVGGYDP